MANDKQTSTPGPRQPAKGGAAGKRQERTAEGARKPRARGEKQKKKPTDGRLATALTANEWREIDDEQPPRAAVLHEVIRVQDEHELQHTVTALWWSTVAAELTIGLSLMGTGLFRATLPEQEQATIVSGFGYPMGFLAVILAHQQLFTENTLTAVLPVMTGPTLERAW